MQEKELVGAVPRLPHRKEHKMEVPYCDLKMQYSALREEMLEAFDRVCRSTSFILGEEVVQFEKEFADYCGVEYCVALNSGTSALHLALLAVGAGPGDEIITTPNTFIATAEAISYTGATPVFVDTDPKTANIDPGLLEAAVTARTKAILPVHLYGRPADLDPILEIAGKYHLPLIEDCCQAHGARHGSRRVGGFGRAGAFSFYPGKNLGAYGEGGALVTNDHEIAEFARAMRDHGQQQRYFHNYVGYNYRMDGFQGAVLRIKLRHLDYWTQKRRQLARIYRTMLAGTCLEMPVDNEGVETVYHVFAVYVDDRDRVRVQLEAKGIQTGIHYPQPIHLQNAYTSLGYPRGSFPNAERACERVLSLPLFPEMTAAQAEYVATALAEIVEHNAPETAASQELLPEECVVPAAL